MYEIKHIDVIREEKTTYIHVKMTPSQKKMRELRIKTSDDLETTLKLWVLCKNKEKIYVS